MQSERLGEFDWANEYQPEEPLNRLVLAITATFIFACSSTRPLPHDVSVMDISRAIEIAEELTWTQHPAFRPDDFAITEKFMAWSYGKTSRTRGISSAIGDTGVVVGSSSSVIRELGDRAYYRSVDRVQLLSWIRKGKQWYAVSLIGRRGESQVILRNRNLEDARLFTDAVSTIVQHFNSVANETSNPSSETSGSSGKNEPQS